MLKRLVGILAAAALAVVGLVAMPSSASAADGGNCDLNGFCYTSLSYMPADPAPAPDSNGWTGGAASCYLLIQENQAELLRNDGTEVFVWSGGGYKNFYFSIPCGGDTEYWSNSRQCMVSMVGGAWPTRPAAYSPEDGYYACAHFGFDVVVTPDGVGAGITGDYTDYFWSETVPPGLRVLTPGVAAMKLIETFQLRGIDIGMAPQVNPEWGHRRTYVGVPVWLWVDNPQPLTWGPYSETATLGGQTITATAQVTSVTWNFGDGQSATCGGTGTPYSAGYGVTDSPTCGHRYQTTSANQSGDRYTVTATSQWTVTWTSLAGPTGTVNLSLSSSQQLEVNELQSVNVDPNNGGEG